MEKIVLASGSPRRRELLESYGIPLVVWPPDLDESAFDHLPPATRVAALASMKADAAIAALMPDDPRWILAADTLVAIDQGTRAQPSFAVLGKPSGVEEAARFMRLLSGRTHSVFTGLCAVDRATGRRIKRVNETKVSFSRLSDGDLDSYLESGEWRDVAGGYRIQERAGFHIERIDGSYTGVVGLPIADFYGIMSSLGYRFR
ncbi:MAG: Maf family protein [Spirochaetes bacterium]|nr:Maf family protein [Spirochaetota bacterium]